MKTLNKKQMVKLIKEAITGDPYSPKGDWSVSGKDLATLDVTRMPSYVAARNMEHVSDYINDLDKNSAQELLDVMRKVRRGLTTDLQHRFAKLPDASRKAVIVLSKVNDVNFDKFIRKEEAKYAHKFHGISAL